MLHAPARERSCHYQIILEALDILLQSTVIRLPMCIRPDPYAKGLQTGYILGLRQAISMMQNAAQYCKGG